MYALVAHTLKTVKLKSINIRQDLTIFGVKLVNSINPKVTIAEYVKRGNVHDALKTFCILIACDTIATLFIIFLDIF